MPGSLGAVVDGAYALQAMARPAHGSLTAPGAKPRLTGLGRAPWESWRGKDEARRAVRWIERYCRVPTGANAGRLFRLAPFQKQIAGDLYSNLAAFESLPTGQGKTTLLGAVGLERICRGDDYAEVDVIATKLGQAEEVVAVAARIAEQSPEIRERCALYDEASELRYRPTGSRLRAQPARLKAVEGLNFNVGMVDEIGFAHDELVESLIARLGKRPDAHLLGIGTPGFEPNMLWRLRRDAGEGSLPAHSVYREWSAPDGCEIDDRAGWRQANPALAAGFLSEQALELQVEMLPEARFRVYHLAQWVDQSAAWLPAGSWEANPSALIPADGSEIVLAVEGTYARTVAVVGAALDGVVFHVWTAEKATDDELRQVLEQALERWRVVELVHNRRIRQQLFRELGEQQLPLAPWSSAVDVDAGSANEFYRAIVEERVPHDHDPLVAQHMANLRIRLLADGSLRLIRPDTGEHCDAGIAARNAWWRAAEIADQIPAEPLRIY
jgi:phage terminase large subunit-like protein